MRTALPLVLACSLWAASCTSSSVNVVAPAEAKCEVSLQNSDTAAIPADGGSKTLSVVTTRDCTWSVTATAAWVTFTTDTTGQGSGSIGYRVAPNAEAVQRRAAIDVNGAEVTVMQEPAPCRFAVTPVSVAIDRGGGTTTVSVSTLNGCAWAAESQAPWITVRGTPPAPASGAVTLAVAPNTGPDRSAAVIVAGQSVQFNQAG